MTQKFLDADVVGSFPECEIEVPSLGVGSFKTAYLIDSASDPRVLKILHEPLQPSSDDFDANSMPERFQREMSGMLSHECPHIVKALTTPQSREIGSETFIWYTEPFYSGGTLDNRLLAGPLPPAEVEYVVKCLLVAVEAMDDRQIVHRDIKPANVAFDATGEPVLLDLGIALFGDLSDLTDSMASSPRTPRYAAPEQFELRRYADIDARTDMYLVGMLGYECLTGRHPFWERGINANEYFTRVNGFQRSQVVGFGASAELERLLGRLLSPKKYRRPRTPAEALKTLETK